MRADGFQRGLPVGLALDLHDRIEAERRAGRIVAHAQRLFVDEVMWRYG
jgi:hypothetical protein